VGDRQLASRKIAFEVRRRQLMLRPGPAFLHDVEPTGQFFVSMPLRGNYAPAGSGVCSITSGSASAGRTDIFGCCGRGSRPRGVKILGFEDERERRRKAEHPLDTDASAPGAASGSKKRKRRGESAEIGQALRSVYDRAVNESIPPEMLDLLGKLD
jgi:hypothetical protein